MMQPIPATVDDAVAAIEAQAVTDGDDERFIHVIALAGPGMILGADWRIGTVIDAVRGAVELRWCDYLGHGLAIEQPNGACYAIKVQGPDQVAS